MPFLPRQTANQFFARKHETPDMTDLLPGFFAPWAIFAGIFGLHIVSEYP